MRWKPASKVFSVAVVSLSSVVAVGCGDDDDEASSVERYCEPRPHDASRTRSV